MHEKLKNIKKMYEKGFFHIIISNILNKIFVFCGGIFLIRILSKVEFGLYSYSQNILSLFLLINGFGIVQGLLQYGSKVSEQKDKEKYVKYSIKIGVLSNLFLIFLIIMYCIYGKFKIEEARKIILLMSGIPIINTIFSIIRVKLITELKNKEMSKISNINVFFDILGMVIGGYINGIEGVIIGKYIGNILSIFIAFSAIKNIFYNWKKIEFLSSKEKKEINKFSFIAMLNNSISQLLYIADVFLIGVLIGDKEIIASYKTATYIPFALNFIPMSLMTFVYPYFSKESNNIGWIKKRYKEIIIYFGSFNIFVSIMLALLSKIIIKIIFGEMYLDSLKPFIVLSIGYFFAATLRIPAGDILAAIGKIKFNFYNAIISGTFNILLDILLIKKFGSIGAAYATLAVFIVSGIIGNIFIYYYLNSKKG